jgi:nitrite reductase/ring-hydroxylating ferredoxin subunit/uncharacterized membrane protein
MVSESLVNIISRQDWLQKTSDVLQPAVKNVFEARGPTGQRVKDALHGKWLGHPLHPVITDIPIGAWTTALVFDIIDKINGQEDYGSAADAAITVGLVGAVGSAVSGVTDWSETNGRARKIGIAHGLLNLSATMLYATSLVMRRSGKPRGRLGLALLGFATSCAAAYLGGHLVYGEQIGVNHAAAQAPPHEFVPVLAEAELPENELRRVEANGVPVLLARRDGTIYALAENCSHMGGPLSEGRLEGDSVRCPWHGSRFSLEDGRVLDSPATFPQPCFEIRVNNGQIEVRAIDR